MRGLRQRAKIINFTAVLIRITRKEMDIKETKSGKHWYALRTTYGRELKAYDYITSNSGTAFCPTIAADRTVNGRRVTCEVARIPNILFGYGTEDELRRFVYDNVHLPFLRFYYRHFTTDDGVGKEPLIVPDRQMESLRIVCQATGEDTIVVPATIQKFSEGQMVRVTVGPFAGMEGYVARFQGQQRVGIVIEDVGTAVTAYIPSGMMEPL